MVSFMTFPSLFIMIPKELCQYIEPRATNLLQLSQEKPDLYLGQNPRQKPIPAFIFLSF